jgi:uncharacterized protein (DUF1778 family)
MEKTQISVNLDPKLKERIERAADKRYMSLAAFIRLACVEYAEQVLGTEISDETTRTDSP